MLHTKFQVSSSSGTYFSGTQIWPKSAVNWVLYVYKPSKRFCTLLGFDFRVMKGCFYDVLGLPYRLASLLIYIIYTYYYACWLYYNTIINNNLHNYEDIVDQKVIP